MAARVTRPIMATSPTPVGELKTEYLKNPLGIQEIQPRFSWVLPSVPAGARGLQQKAYQILVASTPEKLAAGLGDLWDSGKVTSSASVQVVYAGRKLTSRQRVYWQVRIWTGSTPSAWSEPASFEIGLLKPADWSAQWIASHLEADPQQTTRPPYLRRGFTARGPIAQARLYVTALGLYEAYINGQRVGEDYFTPGWTDYSCRVQYQTYDVTALLQAGDNALGVTLADGWFAGHLAWGKNNRNRYGHPVRLLAQLEITYADGTCERVVTDETWKSGTGPILAADIYHGESYDARLADVAWTTAGFDDHAWGAARRCPLTTKPVLQASASPRVRKIEELPAKDRTEPTPGVYIFDLGQNMIGWARLKLSGPAGTTVTIRYAEVLNPDGTLYIANLRSAKCTDTYVLNGQGQETYEPRFTFHGFRYVEITGLTTPPALDAVTGVVVHTATARTGHFASSDPLLNQLFSNIIWGQKGNFLEVPTDCPQRDERLGWTGDAQVFIQTACYNMDVAGFFTKWTQDLRDAQPPQGSYPMVAPDVLGKWLTIKPAEWKTDGGPGWADAGVICPWTIYLAYGDVRILERHYASMVKYGEFITQTNLKTRHSFNDWLHHDANTPLDVTALAYNAHTTDLLGRIAGVLGKKKDQAKYTARFKKMQQDFARQFLTSTGRVVGDTQTAYALALRFNLIPPAMRAAALEHMVFDIEHGRYTNTWKNRNTHLSTGFLGVKPLIFALSDGGRLDIAYKLLFNEDYPSWLFPVKNGATTIWERWDGWTTDKGFQSPGMNSFNHYAYGAIGEWLYSVVAGIRFDPAAPGGKRWIIHPQLPPVGSAQAQRLTQARASFASSYGMVTSGWTRAGATVTMEVIIPSNTTAQIILPTAKISAAQEHGKGLKSAPGLSQIKVVNGRVTCLAGSGTYRFTVRES
jgi:alpha-L-rhamnosidase